LSFDINQEQLEYSPMHFNNRLRSISSAYSSEAENRPSTAHYSSHSLTLSEKIEHFSFTANELTTLMEKFQKKVKPREIKYKIKVFENCFTGTEAVDAFEKVLKEHYRSNQGKKVTRTEVIHFVTELFHRGFLFHVTHQYTFKDADAPYLYKVSVNLRRVSNRHEFSLGILDSQKYIDELNLLQKKYTSQQTKNINRKQTIVNLFTEQNGAHLRQNSGDKVFPTLPIVDNQGNNPQFKKNNKRSTTVVAKKSNPTDSVLSSLASNAMFKSRCSTDTEEIISLSKKRSNSQSSAESKEANSVVEPPRPTTPEETKEAKLSKGRNSLLEMLHDEDMRTLFKEFAKKEISDENVLFWEEVEKYKKVESQAERQELAVHIYQIFIPADSEYCLNLPAHLYRELAATYSSGDVHVFDKTQTAVETCMSDTFRRFKLTDTYDQLIS